MSYRRWLRGERRSFVPECRAIVATRALHHEWIRAPAPEYERAYAHPLTSQLSWHFSEDAHATDRNGRAGHDTGRLLDGLHGAEWLGGRHVLAHSHRRSDAAVHVLQRRHARQ